MTSLLSKFQNFATVGGCYDGLRKEQFPKRCYKMYIAVNPFEYDCGVIMFTWRGVIVVGNETV